MKRFVLKETETGKYVSYSELGIRLVDDISQATFMKKEIVEVLVFGADNLIAVEVEIKEIENENNN